ncbi:pyroglutamyl-peptidase 1-like protein [Willisornis vidua]|uniref:Pyroglutamyl-peptidase 1-like protein n=1 Tax=Willisornis vidua TaxID=1566151 RepID=A0ABQ9DMB0_9PASS|nr:pyroglutamyl-peptidase 1-like protein [Willisornis vidua]
MAGIRSDISDGGFGPFGEHAVNASWIAVQELEKLGLRDDVDLHVYEVPVEYQTVQRLIPALWKKHSPQRELVNLEDFTAQSAPIHGSSWYLCDFTYYTSLYQSRGRSAFVHVPPLDKPYSAEQLGRALQAIVEEMLDLLEHSGDKISCQHEH